MPVFTPHKALGTIPLFGSSGFSHGSVGTPEAGFAVEFNVDNLGSSGLTIGAQGGSVGTTDIIYFNSTGQYRTSVTNIVNTGTAWVNGDKIGMILFLNNGDAGADGGNPAYVAFFRNGVLIGSAPALSSVGAPLRFFVTIGTSGGGSMTITTDIAAMAYGAAYKAFRQAGVAMLDADSWAGG